jgi:hypothetical protein
MSQALKGVINKILPSLRCFATLQHDTSYGSKKTFLTFLQYGQIRFLQFGSNYNSDKVLKYLEIFISKHYFAKEEL